jgi:hypothetical protein
VGGNFELELGQTSTGTENFISEALIPSDYLFTLLIQLLKIFQKAAEDYVVASNSIF